MRVRTHGTGGPLVVVLHGGPGAAGSMAPVARGLADRFTVLEPWQRRSGAEPLTVARHVEDLDELVRARCGGAPFAMVGSSWGAMLALAWAAEHPERGCPLVLVGCGSFDRAARAALRARAEARTDDALRRRLAALEVEIADPDERLRVLGDLLLPVYSCDLVSDDLEVEECDARAHQETWDDMVRLQDAGVYPAAFAAIEAPVLMLHGAEDPHPGGLILDSLRPFLPRIEYREWASCGHYPWLERAVRDEFFAVLRAWLARRTGGRA